MFQLLLCITPPPDPAHQGKDLQVYDYGFGAEHVTEVGNLLNGAVGRQGAGLTRGQCGEHDNVCGELLKCMCQLELILVNYDL